MTDLTEQWKKGELPEGYYWVKVKEEIANYPILADCVKRYEYYDIYTYFPEYEESITSVLAPVPSYEEYLSLTYAKEEDEKIIAEYEEENAQLKELLKECKDLIELMQAISGIKQIKFTVIDDFVKKINEVLDA